MKKVKDISRTFYTKFNDLLEICGKLNNNKIIEYKQNGTVSTEIRGWMKKWIMRVSGQIIRTTGRKGWLGS